MESEHVQRSYASIIISMRWTPGLYRLVTISIAPGKRISAILGPRGATEAEVRRAAADLVAHIKP